MPAARPLNQINRIRERELLIFFRCKHITSLKNHLSLAQGECVPEFALLVSGQLLRSCLL